MRILQYESRFHDLCVSLFIKVFNSPPWNDQWDFEKASHLINCFANYPGFKSYLLLVEEKLVAALFGHKKIWWNGDEFHIEEMYVDPERQNQKYGTCLLEHIKADLCKEGVSSITLLTDRRIPAKQFYESNGFSADGGLIFMKTRI